MYAERKGPRSGYSEVAITRTGTVCHVISNSPGSSVRTPPSAATGHDGSAAFATLRSHRTNYTEDGMGHIPLL